jgi:RimJ/RimL family protein N-acetyltransferase
VLSLRRALTEDEARLLEWRNEPVTRTASFTTAEIRPDEHHLWFERKLADPGCAMMIVEEDGRPVGQLRLDLIAPEVAEVSIGLAPGERGRGIGRQALRLAAGEALGILGARTLRALVRPDNVSSLNAFEAAGFVIRREDPEIVLLEMPSA